MPIYINCRREEELVGPSPLEAHPLTEARHPASYHGRKEQQAASKPAGNHLRKRSRWGPGHLRRGGRPRCTLRAMSFLAKGLDALSSKFKNALNSGFVPQTLSFEGTTVVTTALLAEGGYSYIYSAKEVGTSARSFAAKKVLAQDRDGRHIAEVEMRLLQQVSGVPGFVRCFGTLSRTVPNKSIEFWMLLEFCPNGSLVDVIYQKKGSEYTRRPPISTPRVLEIIEQVAAALAHLHALDPPITHRDVKLENVLGAADGQFVLCDFGSATTNILPAQRTRKEAVEEEEQIHR